MKKLFLSGILSFSLLTLWADDVQPALVVSCLDGTETSVALADIRTIRFVDGKMCFLLQGEEQSIAVDAIASVTFGSISTAIETLLGESLPKQLTVTDLSGKVLFRYQPSEAITDVAALLRQIGEQLPSAENRTYLLQLDGVVQKISIR